MSPALGVFLSRDPWEGSVQQPFSLHGYLYVSANPVNLVDPAGLLGEKPEGEACSGWLGPAKLLCEAAERGSFSAREMVYRLLALGGRQRGWKVASDLLRHSLKGSGTTSAVYLDSNWLLQCPDCKKQRDARLMQFWEHYLVPASRRESRTRITAVLKPRGDGEPGTDPYLVVPDTSSDVGVALGKHYIDGLFVATTSSACSAMYAAVSVVYSVNDRFDFENGKALDLGGLHGVGEVPHRWINSLIEKGRAAEFDVHVEWAERRSIILPKGEEPRSGFV